MRYRLTQKNLQTASAIDLISGKTAKHQGFHALVFCCLLFYTRLPCALSRLISVLFHIGILDQLYKLWRLPAYRRTIHACRASA